MDVIGGVLMKNNDHAIRSVIAVVLLTLGTSISANSHSPEPNIDQTDDIIKQVNIAFDKAEDEILNIGPKPDPAPDPVGPDPDPDKCVCGGTGIITHGDGHTTDCPYHKQKDEATGCKEDCKKDCGEECDCASGNKGCIHQAPDEEDEAIVPEVKYELQVFGGHFCGPCRQMDKDVWQNLVDPKKYTEDPHKTMKIFLKKNNVKFKKYVWEDKEDRKAFSKHNILTLPAMLLLKDGVVIATTKGYMGKDAIKSLINKQISKGG